MSNWKTYFSNWLRNRLDKLGYEEIVDPTNPFRTGSFKPQPDPWAIAQQLVQAVQAQDLATRLPEGNLKSALTRSASSAITQILDDTCGTPPGRWPWPWPGPPPWVWEIASELSTFAARLSPGRLQDGIFDVAGKVISHSSEQVKRG